MQEQASKLTLTSRAFFNSELGPYEQYICEYFGFDRVLPMNTGVEADETAFKLARRWAYEVKGVPENKAQVLFAEGGFSGRTITMISASTDPDAYGGYGPLLPGVDAVPYGDVAAFENAVKANPNIAAFLVEPIQGEAGVVVPPENYLRQVRAVCDKYNVLLIGDEVQTGLARTGRPLALDWEGVRPDILVLGKALSGGMLPVSAVLADDKIMKLFRPGQHGSTYGGNPLACVVAREALQVLRDEGLSERSAAAGETLRGRLGELVVPAPGQRVTKRTAVAADTGDQYVTHVAGGSQLVQEVRGKGMLNAIVIAPVEEQVAAGIPADRAVSAEQVCMELAQAGLLAKPTHEHIIRFAPPLVLTDAELDESLSIVESTIQRLDAQAFGRQ